MIAEHKTGIGGESGGVSVVIPTCNSAALAVEAVRSALNQTHPVWEVIVVDDGGTDDTADRLRGLDPRVRYVRRPNGGPALARNTGILLARGEWIALLDADDVWLPDKTAIQLEEARRTNVAAVLGACRIAESGDVYCYSGRLDRTRLLAALLCGNVLAGGASTALIHRGVFDRVGLFDPSLNGSEDRDFFIRLVDHCPIGYVRRPVALRRAGPVAYGGDAARTQRNGDEIIRRHAHRLAGLPAARLIVRRARAGVLRRAGMHRLHAGNRRQAADDLRRSVWLWPFQADPWRAMINALLGRLPPPPARLAGLTASRPPAAP